eukprot:TRINITY_DN16090_c0_g1_i1.p1 TRINITY_DN16090_c0_g1~~TRINITY_DN16090_c0_g1_i1.p1  ORF type:complete len:136 (-),score=41.76 TRINITY_DN16090_c0_g1_i1:104-487(-)
MTDYYHRVGKGYFEVSPSVNLGTKGPFNPEELKVRKMTGPKLSEVKLNQVGKYLKNLQWKLVPENMIHWYAMKYYRGPGKCGTMGKGMGTAAPLFHWFMGCAAVGVYLHIRNHGTAKTGPNDLRDHY